MHESGVYSLQEFKDLKIVRRALPDEMVDQGRPDGRRLYVLTHARQKQLPCHLLFHPSRVLIGSLCCRREQDQTESFRV